MSDKIVVFKSPIPYKKKLDTKIEKIDFFTGLINYGTRIFKSGSINGAGNLTIYTVPVGKAFYLTFLNWNVGTQTDGNLFKINISSETFNRITLFTVEPNAVSRTLVFAPNIPLLLKSQETINFSIALTNATAELSIVGYEVDASLVPSFT